MTSIDANHQATQERYDQNGILSMKATLQRTQHSNLESIRLNDFEIFLMCENTKTKNCQFVYIFRKKNCNRNDPYFSLISINSTHSEECISSRATSESCKSSNSKLEQLTPSIKNIEKEIKNTKSNLQLNNCNQLNPNQGLKDDRENQTPQKSKRGSLQNSRFSELYSGQKAGSIYKEEQIPALKKLLVNKYNALISKSTCIDPTTHMITRITFKCKNHQKNECKFQQRLNSIQNNSGNLFQLQSIHSEHLPECIMDQQELRYYEMTRQIDYNMDLIENIINKIALQNQKDVRPKVVLQILAKQLGHESGKFIYESLQSRNNRRGVKKYFDNAVGKIRNKYKY